jgi:hypothetical protein
MVLLFPEVRKGEKEEREEREERDVRDGPRSLATRPSPRASPP